MDWKSNFFRSFNQYCESSKIPERLNTIKLSTQSESRYSKIPVSFFHRSLNKKFSSLGQDSVEKTCIWVFVSEIWWFSSSKKEETSDYVRKSN